MKKKLISFILSTVMCISMFSNVAFATETEEPVQEEENSEETETVVPQNQKTFALTAEENPEKNSIQLNWTKLEDVQSYQIFQKKPNSIDEFQSISAADLEDIDLHIEVLNIYPSVGNNLKTWMEENGYGKGLMTVTPKTMDEFNQNPAILKNSDGTWKYDVIVIGFWDCNNYKDINDKAKAVLEEYIQSGRGMVFGHDTICSCINPGFRSLQTYINLTVPDDENWTEYLYGGDETVSLQKTGLFNTYPWNIGGIDTVLTIPYCHNVGQFANSDIWLKFGNETGTFNGWNFYLTSYNNCAMIMTGHSNGAATDDEQKILANTIFYTYQLTNKDKHLDHSGQDVGCPGLPYITVDTENRIVNLNSLDTGSEYTYFVRANLEDNTNVETNRVTETITTGVKGYYYLFDNKAFTEVDDLKKAKYTEGAIDASELEGNTYLHAFAVDGADNHSSTVHINVDALPEIIRQPESVSVHATESRTATFKVEAKGDFIMYQWQKLEGEEWVNIEGETRPTYKTDIITPDMDGNTYRCLISNDTSFIYTNDVSIEVINLTLTIPRDINVNGNQKTAEYELTLDGELKKKELIAIPDEKIQLSLNNNSTTYGTFTYEGLKGMIQIVTGTEGNWQGSTTFKLQYIDAK